MIRAAVRPAIRTVRVLPLLFLPLSLVSCGTEEAGAGSAPRTSGSADAADRSDPAELDARARALGIAPEFVYVTEAPGFTLAQQSVGVYGGDGFSATFVAREGGGRLGLLVDRGTLTEENCPKTPAGEVSRKPVTCERDGDAWYRRSGGTHEYAIPRDGHVIRLSGDVERVDRAVLREAAEAVHPPDATELAALLPPAPDDPATGPVERGDLPPVGDGAPDNEVGTTG